MSSETTDGAAPPPLPSPLDEVKVEFLRSSGPGGQNVNKVETAVRVRFDVPGSLALGADVKSRLLALAGRRATLAGEILVVSRKHRTREENRRAALARLAELIAEARKVPRRRRATKPGKAARARRLEAKERRSEVKRERRRPGAED